MQVSSCLQSCFDACPLHDSAFHICIELPGGKLKSCIFIGVLCSWYAKLL